MTGSIVAVSALLPQVTRVEVETHGHGLHGQGSGRVCVEREADPAWTFHESGLIRWQPPGTGTTGKELEFTNTLHWQVREECIELAHGRFGRDREVFLLRLIEVRPVENTGDFTGADLLSPEPHHCGNDRYHAALRLQTDGFDLLWRIEGPGKNQLLMHQYR